MINSTRICPLLPLSLSLSLSLSLTCSFSHTHARIIYTDTMCMIRTHLEQVITGEWQGEQAGELQKNKGMEGGVHCIVRVLPGSQTDFSWLLSSYCQYWKVHTWHKGKASGRRPEKRSRKLQMTIGSLVWTKKKKKKKTKKKNSRDIVCMIF